MTEGDPLPDVEVTGGMFGIIHIHQPIGVNIFIYADQARKLISDLEKLLERRRPNGGRYEVARNCL